jgi:hypothetical protein
MPQKNALKTPPVLLERSNRWMEAFFGLGWQTIRIVGEVE